MAIHWMDSFDHYLTADLTEKYAVVNTGVTTTILANGRHGSFCYGPAGGFIQTPGTPVDPTTVIIGAAVRLEGSAATGGGDNRVFLIMLGSSLQLSLVINNGTLKVLRGSTVIGTSPPGIFPISLWVHIEMKVVVHPVNGSVIVRVAEVPVITNAGPLNTANTGSPNWSSARLGDTLQVAYYDDWFVLDGSGPAPLNDLIGDCRVDWRRPLSEGDHTDWGFSGAANRALTIDEAAPNDDSDYNATATVGAIDTFHVEAAPVSGAVFYGAQMSISQKKTDAGTCAVAPVVRFGTTDVVGTPATPAVTYAYAVTTYPVHPVTGLAWDEDKFNATQFGYKRTA